jgi:propionyl-CoA:succinyl-CoA transferase
MPRFNHFPKLTPEEAAAHIPHGSSVAFSGFANAGGAKTVPRALANRARKQHLAGEEFKIRVLTGASGGVDIDEALAQARAISWRAPYQSGATLRKQINRQEVEYVDMHLSHVSQTVATGFFGKIDVAVIEATEITPDGRVFLTTSIGCSPIYLKYAERVIIEVNRYHSRRLREMTDIVILPPPPHRNPLPVIDPLTKIGWGYAVVDPKKVLGVVENDEPDYIDPPGGFNGVSHKIAEHVIRFLFDEMHAKRIPETFLPVQIGVGNLANGVAAAMGKNPYIPHFNVYSLIVQDSLIDLMEQGKVTAASATALTLSPDVLTRVYKHMDFFVPRIVLRPQAISNHPAVIRRLGVIAVNGAFEVDIYGNVNSSHLYGTDVVNGVGGSGEFTRNSYLPIIMLPSIRKGGTISTIVPMCPHIDSNEHSVQVVVTEQGLADLRGLGPMQRARLIIDRCAHPAYRDYLNRYIEGSRVGHIRHNLRTAFELHRNLMESGTMLPDLDLSQISAI